MTVTRVLRHIRAPRQRVYEALVHPESVQRWMVPEGMTSQVQAFDAREGGTFRISLTYDDRGRVGKTERATDTFEGRLVKLVPGREIVQVVEFESEDPELFGEMTITYSLRKADRGGTNLVAVYENLPRGARPEDNVLDWKMSIDRLASLVEEG